MLQVHPIYDDTQYAVGSIVQYPIPRELIVAPFAPLDGQTLSRTEHADLFQQMSTLFGEGDGETTFEIPNFNTKLVSEKDFYAFVKENNGKIPSLIAIGDPEKVAFAIKISLSQETSDEN